MREKGPLSVSNYIDSIQRILAPSVLLIFSLLTGTIGFILLEKMSLFDAFYMTMITMTSFGYREGQPLSHAGKILTIIVLILGIATVAYVVGTIVEFIVEGNIVGIRRRRKMEKKLEDSKDHFIISGFGRVGHQIAAHFEAERIPYVVIDIKPETAFELEAKGIPYIIGNVSSDEVLEKAGIKKAKGLVAAADSDVENVYVTLAAKDMNDKLFIVARAGSKEIENKLKKAGADKVISPYYIAGSRMASMALTPVAVDFLDIVTGSDHIEFWLKEFKVKESSLLSGKTLGEANVRKNTGAMVLAIKNSQGVFDLSPKADSRINPGDIVVAMGTTKQLNALGSMA
jgi:voltage-gated potassium channel